MIPFYKSNGMNEIEEYINTLNPLISKNVLENYRKYNKCFKMSLQDYRNVFSRINEVLNYYKNLGPQFLDYSKNYEKLVSKNNKNILEYTSDYVNKYLLNNSINKYFVFIKYKVIPQNVKRLTTKTYNIKKLDLIFRTVKGVDTNYLKIDNTKLTICDIVNKHKKYELYEGFDVNDLFMEDLETNVVGIAHGLHNGSLKLLRIVLNNDVLHHFTNNIYTNTELLFLSGNNHLILKYNNKLYNSRSYNHNYDDINDVKLFFKLKNLCEEEFLIRKKDYNFISMSYHFKKKWPVFWEMSKDVKTMVDKYEKQYKEEIEKKHEEELSQKFKKIEKELETILC